MTSTNSDLKRGGSHSSVDSSAPTILQSRVRIIGTPHSQILNYICHWVGKRTKINKRGRVWPIKKLKFCLRHEPLQKKMNKSIGPNGKLLCLWNSNFFVVSNAIGFDYWADPDVHLLGSVWCMVDVLNVSLKLRFTIDIQIIIDCSYCPTCSAIFSPNLLDFLLRLAT